MIKTQEIVRRSEIDEELHRIHDIAERQMERLLDICRRFDIKYQEGETPETTAMRVFLHEKREAFDEVYDYYLYDIYVEKLYHYRFDGSKIKFSGSDLDCNVDCFQKEVEKYFQEQGKSDDCFIRKGVAGDKFFFIIARGDCVKTQLEFLNKRIIPRSFRPARQDMIVFNPATSTISVTSSARSLDDKKKYVEEFGKQILGLKEIPEMTFKEKLVDAEPLKDEKFYEPTKEIERIAISQIVLWRQGSTPATIQIRSKDVAKSLEEMHFKLQYYSLISIVLKFKLFDVEKEIQIVINPPEHTEIKVREGKDVVEKYLKDKGVLLV